MMQTSDQLETLNSEVADVQNAAIRNCLKKIRDKYKRKTEEKNKQLVMFESFMKVLNGQIDGLLASTDYCRGNFLRSPRKKPLAAGESNNSQSEKNKGLSYNSEYDRIVSVRKCVAKVMEVYKGEAVEKNKQLAKTESLIKNIDDQTEFTRKRLIFKEELKKKKAELLRAEPQRNSIDDLIALSSLEDTNSSNIEYQESALNDSNNNKATDEVKSCYNDANLENKSVAENSKNNSSDDDSEGNYSEEMNFDESSESPKSVPSKAADSTAPHGKVLPSNSPAPKPKQPSRRSSLDMDVAIITAASKNIVQPTQSDLVKPEDIALHKTTKIKSPAATTSFQNSSPSHSSNIPIKKDPECHFCYKCNQTFTSSEGLQGHKILCHSRYFGKHKCLYCSYCAQKKSILLRHMKQHIKKRPYECPECRKVFNAKSTLIDHISFLHAVKSFSCHLCDMSFIQKTDLQSHLRVHTDERMYICPVCYQTFSQKLALKRHKEEVHPNSSSQLQTSQQLELKKCKEEVRPNSASQLQTSQQLELKKCKEEVHPNSASQLQPSQQLKRHKEEDHPNSTSQLRTSQQLELKRHKEEIHPNSKHYTCSICKLSFASKSEKVEHQQKLGKTSHECSNCSEKFHRKSSLRLHRIKKHNKNFPYRCKICSKGFLKSKLVEQHFLAKHT